LREYLLGKDLQEVRGHIEPVEAYVLASLVVDVKISEIVDRPNWIVSSYLPLAIFG
jgi:acetamidase/formamidase